MHPLTTEYLQHLEFSAKIYFFLKEDPELLGETANSRTRTGNVQIMLYALVTSNNKEAIKDY